MLFQKYIEICQIAPIEQDHSFAMLWNVAVRVLSAEGNRCDGQSHTQAGKAKYRFQHAGTLFTRKCTWRSNVA
jgi:hypothetical protein